MSELYALHSELGALCNDHFYYNEFNELDSEMGPIHTDSFHMWWIGI